MSTSAATIDHLLDLLSGLPGLSARKMFGEYALFVEGKVVALVCDDQVFLKPTDTALALLPGTSMAPPYPGAKPHLLLTDTLDDADLIRSTLRQVAAALPPPKPKAAKKPKLAP